MPRHTAALSVSRSPDSWGPVQETAFRGIPSSEKNAGQAGEVGKQAVLSDIEMALSFQWYSLNN